MRGVAVIKRARRLAGALALAGAAAGAAAPAAHATDASIVINAETGRVLHANNPDARLYPASLVKMMTLYMTFEALEEGRLRLSEELYVSRRAEGMTPTELYLQAGETISVRDAILGIVTKSANDAAVVLAEALAPSEFQFALDMTEKARDLGLTNTQFRNASGLPNAHQVASARDMARLGQALIRDFPQFYPFFARETFRFDGETYHNHNNLLEIYPGTDGIKTGYTQNAGFNIVTSVERQGHRLIAVVMGAQSARARDRYAMTLLDRGFAELQERQPVPVAGPPAEKPTRAVRLAAARNGAGGVGDVSNAAVPTPPDTGRPDDVQQAGRSLAHANGPWAIQVGAYSRTRPARLAALEAADQAPNLLTGAEVAITETRASGTQVYRARLRNLSRPRAMQACRLLESHNHGCLVIKPSGGIAVAFDAP